MLDVRNERVRQHSGAKGEQLVIESDGRWLNLRGEVDLATRPQLEATLTAAIDSGHEDRFWS